MGQRVMSPVRVIPACKRAARRLNKLCRDFVRDTRGSVAMAMGVALSVLMGMVALGTEISFIEFKQRQMQATADAAALSAAMAKNKGYPLDFELEAKAIAASSGFISGVDQTVITVNSPPLSGSQTQNSDAVEVIIQQPQTLRLVSLFTSASFDTEARAVAIKGQANMGDFCLLALDPAGTYAVDISNGAQLTLNNCGIAINSTASPALSVVGGARIDAKSVSASGMISVSNGGAINATDGVFENQPPIPDPYANVNINVPSGCMYNNIYYNWSNDGAVISPGTYCEGLHLLDVIHVTMSPGIYYVKSGQFQVSGGVTLTGTDVTIVLTKNTGTYANVDISGGSNVTLSAPTSGPTAGLLFFADRNTPTGTKVDFAGGAGMSLTGALYFPTMLAMYSNNAGNTTSCTQLIAWRMGFVGGSRFNRDCDNTPIRPIGAGSLPELVE